MRVLVGFVVLAACTDYTLEGDDKATFETGDSDPFDSDPALDDTAPGDTGEACDGLDDDGDGEVDEGYPDVDADGIADCVDDACVLAEPAPRSEHDDTCVDALHTTVPPAHPWDIGIEWEVPIPGAASTPVVGDLDHDGAPEVVWVDYQGGGRLVVADGATGTVLWSRGGPEQNAGPALGDLDGDGYGDIVVARGEYGAAHVVDAYDRSGNLLWSGRIGVSFYAHPAIADADGDGTAEVLVNEYVLDGATGVEEARMDVASGENFGAGFFADLDLDGTAEVLVAGGVFNLDGTLRTTCGVSGELQSPLVAQLDADPEGEVLNAGRWALTACDTDGTVLWERSARGYVGTPSAVDMDGDGLQEIVMPDSDALRLLGPDGVEIWSVPISDVSGAAGATLWDVDLDGAAEIFYRDEQQFILVNGATGTIEAEIADRGSWTSWETPAIADVDGDGAGEIVFVTAPPDGSQAAVVVVGNPEWPPARPVYNQATFSETNVDDALGIPTHPEPGWLLPGAVFRGQLSPTVRQGLPNARVMITDVCVASCEPDGLVSIMAQLWNTGERPLPADTVVALYGTAGGVETLLTTMVLGEEVTAGGSTSRSFATTVAEAGGLLLVEVDGDATVSECHEDDNSGAWSVLDCP